MSEQTREGGYGPVPAEAFPPAGCGDAAAARPMWQTWCGRRVGLVTAALVATACALALAASALHGVSLQHRPTRATENGATLVVKEFGIPGVQVVRDRLFGAPAATPAPATAMPADGVFAPTSAPAMVMGAGGDPTLQATQDLAAAAAASPPTSQGASQSASTPATPQQSAIAGNSNVGVEVDSSSATGLGGPVEGWGNGFCGINANPHLCPQFLSELAKLGDATNILCHDGGGETPCDLFHLERDWDMVDPRRCKRPPGLLFLWDTGDYMNAGFDPVLENDPLCGGNSLPDCPTWAAQAWMEYADKWKSELAQARSSGLGIASPRFSGDVMGKFAKFFAACPDCSKMDSPYYIEALGFNQGVGHQSMQQDVANIKSVASQLKQTYPNRKVILANTHCAGDQASVQADFILNSGLFDKAGSPLDAVYWNVYPQGFSDKMAWSVLPDYVREGPAQGKRLSEVLLEHCGPQR